MARTSSSKFTIINLVALSIIPLINDARSCGISEVYMLLAECSSLRKVNWHPQKQKFNYSKRILFMKSTINYGESSDAC